MREVRLIDETGAQIGVVPIEEARKRAEVAGLDLVEVSPDARPPVCKILDYGKFKYQIKKRAHKSKAHQSVLKEIRIRPKIDKHDLGYKVEQAKEFILAGDKVQVTCVFRGREMSHPEFGKEVLRQVEELLKDVAKIERPAMMEGKRLSMLLARKVG